MTEQEYIAKIRHMLAEENEKPESAFDGLVPQMQSAYARENGISERDLEIIFVGDDNEDLMDEVGERFPLTNEIAASACGDGDDDD